MKNYIYIVLILLFQSCKEQTPKEVLREKGNVEIIAFKKYEDSLGIIKRTSRVVNQKDATMYANRCLELANRFPDQQEAPKLLDKAHMIFSNLGSYRSSVSAAEILISRYPSYKNRALVIESVANTYDIFLLPREKSQVKKYYEFLLSEYPKLASEKRSEVQFRLENIDLSMEELIALQQKK